jgi:diaminopimelate decarboxylase/aspartate kinase
VLKVGGTSVASVARWRCVERIVREHLRTGRQVLLVCSAVASVTDLLGSVATAIDTGNDPGPGIGQLARVHHELANALGLDASAVLVGELDRLRELVVGGGAEPLSPRGRARLLAFGELLSTRLGAAYLALRGLPVARVDARELLLALPQAHPMDHFLSASCAPIERPDARALLDATGASVVVTQGFIARDEGGETVLLGRGGSDASAAYLAAAISAEAVEIRSDVPGLFTADPRACPDARLLRRASYSEAETLGSLGAKALHPRTIEPLRELGIPLYLGATESCDTIGTKVTGARARRGVKAVTVRRDLALVVMTRPSRFQPVGFMADVAACFQRRGLSMDLVAASPSEIRATVDLAAIASARAQLDALVAELGDVCRVRVLRGVGSLSLVGTGLGAFGIPCARLLDLLSRTHVHLVVHGANGTHVTYVVEQDALTEILVVAHRALLEARGDDDLFGPPWELRPDEAVPSAPPIARTAKEVAA